MEIELNETKAAQEYLDSPEYEAIKSDLLDQLDRNGTTGEYYKDLVNDYMSLWVTKCLAIQDVKQRGVNIKWQNGATQHGYRKNDSVDMQIRVNGQMLNLIRALGIEPFSQGGEVSLENFEM